MKGYSPHSYYRDVQLESFCSNCSNRHPLGETIEQVVVGKEISNTFPIEIQGSKCNSLIDTVATKSCISESYYRSFPASDIKNLHWVLVRSATGSNLCPIGFVTCVVEIGTKKITNNFIVCKHLMRPVIITRDFIYHNDIKVSYYRNGETKLKMQEEELMAAMDMVPNPSLKLKTKVTLPLHTLAILTARGTVNHDHMGQLFENKMDANLQDKHQNLHMVPMVNGVDDLTPNMIPIAAINLGDKEIRIARTEDLGYLTPLQLDVSEISRGSYS